MDQSMLSRRELIKRAGAAGLVLPFAGGVLAGCGSSGGASASGPAAGGDALAHLKQVGVARLAIANEPPYTKVTTDGQVTGASPDIARAVFKLLGVGNVEGVITPYDAMIPGLNANRWDVITAGLFMKKSRCAQIIYSEPDVVSTESFAVKPGNPKGIGSVADVKANDVKIGVLPGGYEDGILKDAKVPQAKVVKVPDGRSGIEALQAGRIDAFFLPTLSLNALKGSGPAFDVTPPVKDAPPTGAGAGFRKSDTKLRDAYNAKMDVLKKNGEFDRILAKWGFSGKAARSVTTKQLCNTPG